MPTDPHGAPETIPDRTGVANNHQTWPGGYFDHVQEIMNIAILLYERLHGVRPLPLSLSDALLIVFLHDIEKPWKYEMGADGQLEHISSLRTKAAEKEHCERQLEEFGIALTPEQLNGLRYVEGELGDYSSRHRVMGSLAAFCHLADVTSACIWFDHPMEAGDPWVGARRIVISETNDRSHWERSFSCVASYGPDGTVLEPGSYEKS